MFDDFSQSSNFGLAALYTDLQFHDYYDSLSEEIQAAVNEHENEIHSLHDLKQFAQHYRKLR
ncbi:MAG: hypothetical protein HFI90_06745 [Clostridia bacterium]|nr:hypothetical protein [Clostridia bacterium]